MTENEAKAAIDEIAMNYAENGEEEYCEALDTAIKALEEVQRCKELEKHLEDILGLELEFKNVAMNLSAALKMVQNLQPTSRIHPDLPRDPETCVYRNMARDSWEWEHFRDRKKDECSKCGACEKLHMQYSKYCHNCPNYYPGNSFCHAGYYDRDMCKKCYAQAGMKWNDSRI